MLNKFFNKESGATLVEYGVALIVAVVVGGVSFTSLAEDTSAQMTEAETILETY